MVLRDTLMVLKQMKHLQFSSEVAERLGYYVYAYIDPFTKEIFYVGKGRDNRAFHHLDDLSETKKVERIKEIRNAKGEPQIEILVHGLTEADALRIEAICIDLIGFSKLTNLITGHTSSWGGRRSVEEIIDEYSAEAVEIEEDAIGITINQSYYYGMSAEELYEVTRGIWVIGERRQSAQFVLAIYRGIVKEMYKVQNWYPAGTTEYQHRQFDPEALVGRCEFIGTVASRVREKYVGKRIRIRKQIIKGSQNPIRYFNC